MNFTLQLFFFFSIRFRTEPFAFLHSLVILKSNLSSLFQVQTWVGTTSLNGSEEWELLIGTETTKEIGGIFSPVPAFEPSSPWMFLYKKSNDDVFVQPYNNTIH